MYFENAEYLPDTLDWAKNAYIRENLANSKFFPSTIKTNSNLTDFFKRWLFQRTVSVFEWTIPETVEKNYFLYTLYSQGYGFVFNTLKYGTVFNHGGLSGYDIQYQPAYAVVANPLLTEKNGERPAFYQHMRIGEDCSILRLSPDYCGIMDIVQYYAELLATASGSLVTNLFNTKFAYVFGAKNKTTAESLKKMYDKIGGGEPAVFIDKQLFDENGNLNVQVFDSSVKNVYVGDQLIEDIRGILNDFDSYIGIPNSNYNKKERMITDEANMNNFETKSLCYTWIEMLQKDIKKNNELFPEFEFNVQFRKEVNNNGKIGDDNTADNVSYRRNNI